MSYEIGQVVQVRLREGAHWFDARITGDLTAELFDLAMTSMTVGLGDIRAHPVGGWRVGDMCRVLDERDSTWHVTRVDAVDVDLGYLSGDFDQLPDGEWRVRPKAVLRI